MGWRFRKSIKILPGIRLNFGKKSVGISIGGKHGGVTVNSKTGVTARASIPGTGISYSERISSGKKSTQGKAPYTPTAKQIYMQEAQNDLRIIGESSKIVEGTVKPDVFFSRLDLIYERYEHLSSIEKFLSFQGELPSEMYEKVKAKYVDYVKEFIEKYFLDSYSRALDLKTVSGRENKVKKSFVTLMQYQEKMNDDCVSLAEKLRDDYLQKLSSQIK